MANPQFLHKSKVLLKVNDVSALADFALKYYRDGIAEVDHLDLEVNSNLDLNYGCYVTFAVTESTPPVTEEKA